MAPEILFEQDQFAICPFFLVGLKLVIKNLRISLTEAVDRLLDISHHEAVVAIGQELQHPLLSVVGILVLIDHDLMVALLIETADMRKFFKNLDGKMADVAKFKGIFLLLAFQICNRESLDKIPEQD